MWVIRTQFATKFLYWSTITRKWGETGYSEFATEQEAQLASLTVPANNYYEIIEKA